ncbi:MAG: hypothetical protein ACFFE2_13045 [Candidatus Thorarchaeota archaeon]
MQPTEIIGQIVDLLMSPIFLFALAMIIVVGAVRYASRSKSPSSISALRQMRRMTSELDKGKDLSDPSVATRQEIITKKFNSQMQELGLEPASDSGYVPVSHTPLARYLKDRGVEDDTVGAILAGLMEEESEVEVRAIINAAAETPGVDLTGEELEKAQELAVSEWNNLRRTREA